MKVNQATLDLIKQFEGLRLKAYVDPASGGRPYTIGYGTTRYPSGQLVALRDTCTEAQAEQFLAHDVSKFAAQVARLVTVNVNPNQFGACVSLAYNIGVNAFAGSTLLRLLNAGKFAEAALEFKRWNRAAGQVMTGLVRRRLAERSLFLTRDSAPLQAAVAVAAVNLPTEEDKPMLPVLSALLPTIVGMIPTLAKVFTDGTSVTDRNVVVAQQVGDILVQATQSTNLQDAVEQMQKDPEKLQAATAAVQAQFYELIEAGGGGIAGAREFASKPIGSVWNNPALLVTAALLPLLYVTIWYVFQNNEGFSNEVRAAIASSIVTGVLGSVVGFWLGSSFTVSKSRGLGAEASK
jgi:lysozyme